MTNEIVFPEFKNENQRKLFQQLQWYCNLCKITPKNERRAWRDQAYGMVMLYITLFPQEEEEITDFWTEYLLVYFSR